MAASGVDILCLPGFTTASWLLFALPFPVSTLDQAHISFALLFPKETWDAHNFFFIHDPQHIKAQCYWHMYGVHFSRHLPTMSIMSTFLFNDLIFAVHFRFTKKKKWKKALHRFILVPSFESFLLPQGADLQISNTRWKFLHFLTANSPQKCMNWPNRSSGRGMRWEQ